jgi:Mn2+/Fe2+ NRAMP family transporter
MSADAHMLLIATSLIGAVVMPHNLYLHSALVLVCKGKKRSFV